MGVAVTTVQDKSTTTEYVPGSTAPTGWAYHPDVPIQMNPLFSWPPKPVASWRWLKSIWLTLSSTLIILVMAILCTQLFLPATAEMASLEPGWIAGIWARNIITLFMVAGGLHWYFYQYKGRAERKSSTAVTLQRTTSCSYSTTKFTIICSGGWSVVLVS